MNDERERELAAAEREAQHDAVPRDRYDVDWMDRPSRRGLGPVVALVVAALVLVVSAAAGWGLAQLVAGVAAVPPPAVTVSPPPPATPTPTEAPVTASPSAAPPTASPGPATPTPIPSQAIHVVQPGEFLSQIAARYGVTTEAIVEANGIEDPNLIEAGQRLIIPPRP